MAKIAKKTKHYPSDLTDEEWERIALLMQGHQHRAQSGALGLRLADANGWSTGPPPNLRKRWSAGDPGANRQWLGAQ